MKFTLEKPAAVLEAAAAKRGMNVFGEIGVFILVFLTVTLGETILMIPALIVLALSNPSFLSDIFNFSFVAEDGGFGFELSLSNDSASAVLPELTLVALFSTLAMIVTVILFCKLIQKRRVRTLGFVKNNWWKEYLKGLLFGFLMFSVSVLICVITGSLSFEGLSGNFALGTFLLFFFGFLIQGMAEEVMMRGYFLVSFGRKHRIWAAVIVNSVLFAALHLLNDGVTLLSLVNITLFGIFASVYFIKSGNIWAIGALHSMWNLIQGTFYGIRVSGIEVSTSVFSSTLTEGNELINGGSFGLEGGLAVTIVLLVCILILFWRYPAESQKTADEFKGVDYGIFT